MERNPPRQDRTDTPSVLPERRDVLRAAGAAGAAAALPFATPVAANDGLAVDDALDTTSSDLQEVLVVFETNADVDRLRHLDLASGYHRFEVLPVGYATLTGDQIGTVAGWPEVRYVEANAELEYHNDDSRENTRAGQVQADLGYTGESVHAVVIDSGVDGSHPDLTDDVAANWRWIGDPLDDEDTMWEDVGDANSDDNGHGTHCSGSITASGEMSDGEFRGMAPDATLDVYSAGLTLLLLEVVAAYDHLLARQRAGEVDVQVVSNSWGSTGGDDFNPDGAVEVATWAAYQEGILSLFSAGNDGPDENTLNPYALAPHVLGVAATHDDKRVTDFSSRGRTPDYDGESNYKRKKALDNLREYHAAGKTDEVVEEGGFSGTVGPGAQDAGAGESEFHEWEAPGKAGYVEATLSWTPSAEDVDFYLRAGSPDGDIVASGATLNEPEELSGAVEGGETYYFEVRPYANVTADYEIEFTAYEGIRRNVHPMGVYRPGVGANGNLVMSTLNPAHPLQAYAVDEETWYGRISGTSMSCPVTAGVACLLFDAAQQNQGKSPDPIDVLNTIEAEAEDVHDSYAPWTVGAGFVDAYDATKRAAEGKWAGWGEVKLVDE